MCGSTVKLVNINFVYTSSCVLLVQPCFTCLYISRPYVLQYSVSVTNISLSLLCILKQFLIGHPVLGIVYGEIYK